MNLRLCVCLLGLGALLSNPAAWAENRQERTLNQATEVLQELARIPEDYIPQQLLAQAHGVAVIPGVIKVGFGVGARHGRGVLVVRQKNGEWSNPSFIKLTGGSVGWQIGGQSTDVILVFKNAKSVVGITNGKFTLGADASVAAGPVGRHTEAATDLKLKAEVYSYSRSRGLFAGVAIEGAALIINDNANATFYASQGITPADVLGDQSLATPAVARRFILTLDATAPPLATTVAAEQSAPRAGSSQSEVKTYALDNTATTDTTRPAEVEF